MDPTSTETTRDVAPLIRRGAIQSVDRAARTFEVVFTTGAVVRRDSWFSGPFDEELSVDPKHVRMGRMQSGAAPFLNSHRSGGIESQLGVIDTARIQGGEGVALVRFPKEGIDKDADVIFNKIDDKIVKNVSVGYRIHKAEKFEFDGKPPLIRAIDWEPHEVSIVPVGADAGAQVRAGDGAHNPCVLVQRNQEIEMDTKEKATATETPDQIRAAATAAERVRVAEITRAGKALGMTDEFVRQHVAAETSPDQFRLLATNERERAQDTVVDTGGGARVELGEAATEKFVRGATDSIIFRAGMAEAVVAAAKKRGETLRVDGGEFRGLSQLDLARECLERAGVRTRGLSKMDLVGKAFTHRSANGSGDFPVLLENAMHKSLQASYQITPVVWPEFCKRGSVGDFRVHNRYKRGLFGRLDVVNEHGEYTNKNVPDGEKETISATTKGNIVALTRVAIINDDMGAFNDMAQALGQAAALSVEQDVFDLLAENSGFGPTMGDGKALFHDDHGNKGTGDAYAIDKIDKNRQLMARQMDPAGKRFLNLRAALLLCGLEIGGTARSYNEAEFDSDGATPNMIRGAFSKIIDTPYITGTTRYLLADPTLCPTFEVAFLEGQESPVVESQNGWRIDGVEWKVRMDYGVAGVDFRGAVIDAGV